MPRGVKHVIVILSGKGGVGKSFVSVLLALALERKNQKIGLLDIDLCGPSIPHLLHIEDKSVHQSENGWVPVYTNQDQSFGVISIGFFLNSANDSVIWRGPKKTAMIKQFLNEVYWQDIDYLIIDTPPGTSDEHITVMQELSEWNCDGAILVTTPQALSTEDVHKEITFCRRAKINIIGIIENMSGYVCKNCAEPCNIFSTGGGRSLAEHTNIPFLGQIPMDPAITDITDYPPDSPVYTFFQNLSEHIVKGNRND